MTTETKEQEHLISVPLEVIQWNVVLTTINQMQFAETRDIIYRVETQVAEFKKNGIEKVGTDKIEFKLTRRNIEHLASIMQNLPFNVVSRIMYVLYSLLSDEQTNDTAEPKQADAPNPPEQPVDDK